MSRKTMAISILLWLIFTCSLQAQSPIPTRGLVSYFPFNGNANDEAGKSNGTLNGPVLTNDRCGNQAYYFDGVDDYIECGNEVGLNGPFAGLSFAAWIKPGIITEKEFGTIMAKWAFNQYNDHFGLWINENYKVVMAVADQRVMESGLFSRSTLEPDLWYHITATWNRKREIKIYINGICDAAGTQTGNGLNTRSPMTLKIGRQVERKSRPFKGYLDEIRIYNRELTAQEVKTIYNHGKAECERIYLVGNVYNKKTGEPMPAEIFLEDLGSNQPYAKINTKEDASFEISLPMGINFGLYPSASDFIPINENVDTRVLQVNNTYYKDLYLVPVEVGESLRLNNVFFDFGKATLRSESYPALNRVLDLFDLFPDLQVEISGHTDWVGSDESNQSLSAARAKAVKDYLVMNRIQDQKIRTIGYGESRPVDTNDTEDGRQLNRRVEFTILNK